MKYYLKNESADHGLYTSYLKPNATGALKWETMSAEEAAANDSTAWYITFTPDNQYYQFRNAATGRYLSYSGGIKTLAKTKLSANENWHLMKGRVDVDGQRGYWIIHPEASWTPRCLQANAQGSTGAITFNIANSATTQRWLILTAGELKAFDKTTAISPIRQSASPSPSTVYDLPGRKHSTLNTKRSTFKKGINGNVIIIQNLR